MRKISNIVIHCSATPQDTQVTSIVNYWMRHLGWQNPGYHYIVEADGTIHQLLPISKVANGVKDNNFNSIHICYIGGIDSGGGVLDNRTTAQKLAIAWLIEKVKNELQEKVDVIGYDVDRDVQIKGHNDFTDKKACPSFKVSGETLYGDLVSIHIGKAKYKW